MRKWFCDNILKPMFSISVSQFHKTSTHRITFHWISNAHACRMSVKTISLFYSCLKIENGTSAQTIFQKTDAQKLLCVFLSSFSAKDYLKIARQCKQTYAIFLPFVVSYYGYYEIKEHLGKIETIRFSISIL